MKKIILFLPIFLFLFSCGDPETELIQESSVTAARPKPNPPIADANKLVRVVFFPGQTYEKRLYFYPNGLLKRVANRFGATYQTYIYDSNKNLINVISSTPYTFTYDASNHLTSCNGKPVVYDALNNKYIFYYDPIVSNDPECPECFDYPQQREITLNNELLLDSDHTYYTASYGDYMLHGIIAGYSGSNMSYVSNWTDPSGPSYSHDNKLNPLKAAFLPVCRALSISTMNYNDRYLTGEFCSANNVIGNDYGGFDPESATYEITYNANNLPVSSIVRSYGNGNLESTRLFAQYFYQTSALSN
jgi:hypothetical protein